MNGLFFDNSMALFTDQPAYLARPEHARRIAKDLAVDQCLPGPDLQQ